MNSLWFILTLLNWCDDWSKKKSVSSTPTLIKNTTNGQSHLHCTAFSSYPPIPVQPAWPAWWLWPHPSSSSVFFASLTWDSTSSSCESRRHSASFVSGLLFFHSSAWSLLEFLGVSADHFKPSLIFLFLLRLAAFVMSSKLWTEEQFNCPVCLDLPNDPVTIPCGHSYCMACIQDFWTKDDPKGIYSCPQCRQTFCPKPSLSRNTMLAEAVEQLRKGARKSDVRDSVRSARGGVSRYKDALPTAAVLCDMCKGEQRAALKSCLVCMSSFCDVHLKPHQTKKSLKAHELIPPTSNLAEKICTQHKYLQEFFCRQCKMYVCWLCTSNQHKDHGCVSTKAERLERQVSKGWVIPEDERGGGLLWGTLIWFYSKQPLGSTVRCPVLCQTRSLPLSLFHKGTKSRQKTFLTTFLSIHSAPP